MRCINAFIKTTIDVPKIMAAYVEGLNFGVLDIETTGLYSSRNKLILGGILYEDEKNSAIRLQQFFAEDREEEAELIEAYLEVMSKLDFVITYNGASFDLPFIEKRAAVHGIKTAGRLPVNIDLYSIIDQYSTLRSALPNLKQKTVETYCGLAASRKDEISGAQSVKLYNEFCRTKNEKLAEKILLHNADDMVQLSKLLTIVQKTDIHQAMHTLGFCCKNKLWIKGIKINKKLLEIKGKQCGQAFDYIGYPGAEEAGDIRFDAAGRTFTLSLPLIDWRGMKIIDLTALRFGQETPKFAALEKYPFFGSGYLVCEYQGKTNYREVNHFAKIYLERILREASN